MYKIMNYLFENINEWNDSSFTYPLLFLTTINDNIFFFPIVAVYITNILAFSSLMS